VQVNVSETRTSKRASPQAEARTGTGWRAQDCGGNGGKGEKCAAADMLWSPNSESSVVLSWK
jgi:hypothetical protein